jgi:phosphohistidine phosphatase
MNRIFPQSGVIPFRESLHHLEILLVTSRSNEEAGIRGQIVGGLLGQYQYRKWDGVCIVSVFPMKVTEILESWPESSLRSRKWFKLENSLDKIKEKDLKYLIETLPVSLRNQKYST